MFLSLKYYISNVVCIAEYIILSAFIICICIFLSFQLGKKVKSSSGFVGKGFRFDDTEAQLVADRKKFQRAAMGMDDSDDENAGMDVRNLM